MVAILPLRPTFVDGATVAGFLVSIDGPLGAAGFFAASLAGALAVSLAPGFLVSTDGSLGGAGFFAASLA